jgi:hypothetical protein
VKGAKRGAVKVLKKELVKKFSIQITYRNKNFGKETN